MRRWFRPRSHRFRVVLGMALMAWAVLASGAFARGLPVPSAMNMTVTMSMVAPQATTTHCDDLSTRRVATQPVPMQPGGYPDCCHGTCHCLATCNAVLTVPYLAIATSLPYVAVSAVVSVQPARMPAAPPLRPPIV